MMRHLVTSKIPFVFDRLVALVASNVASDGVHVQYMLLQIKLVGEISIAVDAEFGLTRLPFFAFSMVTRGGIERFIRS